jgi:hypothetical protein
VAPVPQAVPSPSPPRGRLPPPDPPFHLPSPAVPLKRHCHHRRAPFLSPTPSPILIPSRARSSPPAPLASYLPRPPVPSPPHREIEAAATASTPHGELTPPATLILVADLPSPLSGPLVLQGLSTSAAGHRSSLLIGTRRRHRVFSASPLRRRLGEPCFTSPCPVPLGRPPGARRQDLVAC